MEKLSKLLKGQLMAECECCLKTVDVDDPNWEKMMKDKLCSNCEQEIQGE